MSNLTADQQKNRIGNFTASQIYRLMGAKGFGKTGETYVYETAAEFLTGEPVKPEFTAASTAWGIDHELEAQIYFEAATGLKIEKLDSLNNGAIAGTPDGRIKDHKIGFEIKCPFNSGNHLKSLLLKDQVELKAQWPEHYWQCYSYLWLTGFEQWKFCSYDPRMKKEKNRMVIINIVLIPEEMELLKGRVNEAHLVYKSLLALTSNL